MDITDSIKNDNNISFVVKGDEIFALQQIIVTTQKSQSQIIASNLTTFYSDKSSLIIGLSEVNGISIPNAEVTVVFDGTPSVQRTDSKGQINLTIPSALLPDEYEVSISYAGDGNHIASSADVKVIVEKMPTQIKASDLTIPYNTGATLFINLSDGNGNAIADTNLTVFFNGNSTVLATDSNGQINLTIPSGLLPKSYEIAVSYESNETHNASSDTIVLTVNKVPTKITAASVTAVYNTNKNLVATLKDSDGKAVANAKVILVLNGARKETSTNSNGQATFAVPSNLVPKTYAASVSYAGDAVHVQSSVSTKVIVKKASVKLTAKKKTFRAKVKTKKYTVVLKNNRGKAMKKVKLTLKVKGKTYKATTNANGKATFKIKSLTKKGKYTAKISYNGDKYFNKLTKSVKITIKK